MLLKASDFIVHDLSPESVFEGCANNNNDGHGGGDEQGTCAGRACGAAEAYKLELVLRKWFAIDPSREMRAFVRDGVLIGALRSLFHPHVHICVCPSHSHFLSPSLCGTDRHIAARCELLRVSERARDAGHDRVVRRGMLDRARQAKVDRPRIL